MPAVALDSFKSLTSSKNGRACGVTSSGSGQASLISSVDVDTAMRANRRLLAKQLFDLFSTSTGPFLSQSPLRILALYSIADMGTAAFLHVNHRHLEQQRSQ